MKLLLTGLPKSGKTSLLVLYAMADWESKSARDAAMQEISARDDGEEIIHGQEKFLEYFTTVASAELVAYSVQ